MSDAYEEVTLVGFEGLMGGIFFEKSFLAA